MTGKEVILDVGVYFSLSMRIILSQDDPEMRTKLLRKTKKDLNEIIEQKISLLKEEEKGLTGKLKKIVEEFVEILDEIDDPSLSQEEMFLEFMKIMNTMNIKSDE